MPFAQVVQCQEPISLHRPCICRAGSFGVGTVGTTFLRLHGGRSNLLPLPGGRPSSPQPKGVTLRLRLRLRSGRPLRRGPAHLCSPAKEPSGEKRERGSLWSLGSAERQHSKLANSWRPERCANSRPIGDSISILGFVM